MKKLLLIEEDPDAREMLAFALENNGFEVIKGQKSTTVDDVIKQNPHVVIIDPSNTKLCADLKANDKCNPLPVIIYSSTLNVNKIVNNCGADAVVAKPFELEDLVHLASRVAYKN
ncbi:MAG TPA: response regulator [Mucilaginibacter sp.]|nr:response regulator transcription factor [Bacteroidota bacterium]HVS91908.1 response regulator [Mucilaginibacter sp.]